jgi:hypothetical protein
MFDITVVFSPFHLTVSENYASEIMPMSNLLFFPKNFLNYSHLHTRTFNYARILDSSQLVAKVNS